MVNISKENCGIIELTMTILPAGLSSIATSKYTLDVISACGATILGIQEILSE